MQSWPSARDQNLHSCSASLIATARLGSSTLPSDSEYTTTSQWDGCRIACCVHDRLFRNAATPPFSSIRPTVCRRNCVQPGSRCVTSVQGRECCRRSPASPARLNQSSYFDGFVHWRIGQARPRIAVIEMIASALRTGNSCIFKKPPPPDQSAGKPISLFVDAAFSLLYSQLAGKAREAEMTGSSPRLRDAGCHSARPCAGPSRGRGSGIGQA